jgi:WhiB family transcriptional regulator, redox-sensing transcriptional regulator
VSTITRRAPDWHYDASCGTADFDVFFGPWREAPSVRAAREAEAKAICAGCAARIPCLEWALRTGTEFGVWGGLSEQERRPLTPARPPLCRNDLHEMTAANIYTYPNGWKTCRACKDARHQERPKRTERAA